MKKKSSMFNSKNGIYFGMQKEGLLMIQVCVYDSLFETSEITSEITSGMTSEITKNDTSL